MYVKRTVLRKLDEISHIIESASASQNGGDNGVFTKRELDYCAKRLRCLAARFLIKECVRDYFQNEMGYLEEHYADIEITNNALGKPMISLFERMGECAKTLDIKDILVSISHSRRWVTAMVVFCY